MIYRIPTVRFLRDSIRSSKARNGYFFLVCVNASIESLLVSGNFESVRFSFIKYLKNLFSQIMPLQNQDSQQKWCELAKSLFEKIQITDEEKEYLGIYYDMSTTYDADVKNRMYKFMQPRKEKAKNIIKRVLKRIKIWKFLHYFYMMGKRR